MGPEGGGSTAGLMRGNRGRSARFSAIGAALAVAAAPLFALAEGGAPAGAVTLTPGVLDPTYGSGGMASNGAGAGATGVALLSNGGTVVSGDAASSGQFRVTTFSPAGVGVATSTPLAGQANSVTVMPNGNIVAAGWTPGGCTTHQTPAIEIYNSSLQAVGSQSLPCSGGTATGGYFSGVATDAAGNIYATGTEFTTSLGKQTVVARFNPSGGLDTSFHATGSYVSQLGATGSSGQAVAVSPNGDAVVVGTETDAQSQSHMAVLAIGTGGSPDGGFGSQGVSILSQAGTTGTGVAVSPAGQPAPWPAGGTIFAVGNAGSNSAIVASFGANGAPNGGFGSSGVVTIQGAQLSSAVYQLSGNTLTAGGTAGSGNSQQMYMVQFNPNSGAPNTGFGSQGTVQSTFPGPASIAGVVAQSDGKVVGAGLAPGATAGSASIGLMRVQGPFISLFAPPPAQTTATGPYTFKYTAALSSPLYSPTTVQVCGPPGSSVNGDGQCTPVTIPAGTTTVSFPVTVTLGVSGGNQTAVAVTTSSGGGVTASPTNKVATAVVLHVPSPASVGYRLVASDGGIFSFHAPFYGSAGAIHLAKPIVGMAGTPSGKGYWLVASDGGIFTYGDAHFYGSTGAIHLIQPIVGMASTADGRGYWLVARDGGIFTYGDAHFYGSPAASHPAQPIIGMATTNDGKGYWLAASNGAIYNYGDARNLGSTAALHLARPIVGIASNPAATGYWLVATDGGIFTFGAAHFSGSTGAIHLAKPIVTIASTPDGKGYWLAASDGGIFAFGTAPFRGSTGNITLAQPIVGMTGE
jgi:uncharacterized delta-60 repeat protein